MPSPELSRTAPAPEPHRPSHSRRGPGAWWASPASGASCGCGASGRAHRPRGPSRSGRTSSSWCTPGRRAPLRSRRGWEPIAPESPPSLFPPEGPLSSPPAPPAARVPQAPAKQGPAREPESERQGAVLKVGGWRGRDRPCGDAPWSRDRDSDEAQSTGWATYPAKTQGWGHPPGPSGELPSRNTY